MNITCDGIHVSNDIRQRVMAASQPFRANDNIADFIQPDELAGLVAEIEEKVSALLKALVIDTVTDHNTQKTAWRIARMLVQETLAGRYTKQPDFTDFPNVKNLDQIYAVGPITVRSLCSHHFMPIKGHAWVGVLPSDRIIGLSKFSRLVRWVMARPQIQEEATVQVADTIEELIKPRGIGVIVKADHLCMTHRGVLENGTLMTTSVMRGFFRDNQPARDELLALVRGQGY